MRLFCQVFSDNLATFFCFLGIHNFVCVPCGGVRINQIIADSNIFFGYFLITFVLPYSIRITESYFSVINTFVSVKSAF